MSCPSHYAWSDEASAPETGHQLAVCRCVLIRRSSAGVGALGLRGVKHGCDVLTTYKYS